MDFYFLTSLVNMLWQIFTILFLLYRFTSFFSMMYNFMLFVGKLFKGLIYIKDQISLYISKRRGYSYLSEEEVSGLPSYRRQEPSFFHKMYTKITDWIFGRNTRTNIPLYETRTSYIHNFGRTGLDRSELDRSEIDRDSRHSFSPRSSRADADFEAHIHNNMMNSNYESTEFYRPYLSSSIYPPPQRRMSVPSNLKSSSVSISISTQTNAKTTDVNTTTETQHSEAKPFDVQDSNVLFNSEFLTKILNPFHTQREQHNEEISQIVIEEGNNDCSSEFEEELLKNPYV